MSYYTLRVLVWGFILLLAVSSLTTHRASATGFTNFVADPSFEDSASSAWFALSELHNGTVTVHSTNQAHNGTLSAELSAINTTQSCPTSKCTDTVRAQVEQFMPGNAPTLSSLANTADSFSAWWYVAPSTFPSYSLHMQVQFSDGKSIEYFYGHSDLNASSSSTTKVYDLGPIPPPGTWFQMRRNLAVDIQGLVTSPSFTRVTAIWFGAFGGTFNTISQGETAWIDDAVVVFDVPPSVPVAVFDSNPSQGTAPLTIQFNASASHQSTGFSGSIIVFMWSFGDGSPVQNVSDPVISHTFTNPGTYTVTLTVFDTNGVRSTPSSVPVRVDSIYGSTTLLVIGGILGLLVGLLLIRRRRSSQRKARSRRG